VRGYVWNADISRLTKAARSSSLIPAVRTARIFILNCLYAAFIAVKVEPKFRLLGQAHGTSFETIIRKIAVYGLGRPVGPVSAILSGHA